MLGRRSAVTDDPGVSESTYEPEIDPAQAGKGRPTPKRSDSRKARRNTAPKDRKEAAALTREKARSQRRVARQALITGDESNLPPRDAGPERRLARDIVDSRFTAGQVLFVVIFVGFLLSIINSPIVRLVSDVVALLSLTLLVVDGARCGRRAKLAVIAKYGTKEATGISSYAFMRAMLPRRFRRPPPKINRGEPIRDR